jgi:hypothetical protein
MPISTGAVMVVIGLSHNILLMAFVPVVGLVIVVSIADLCYYIMDS